MGHITDIPEWIVTANNGRAPAFWFGDTTLDGTLSPWIEAPIGSIYVYKPDATTTPITYQKIAVTEATTDWGVFTPPNPLLGDAGRVLLKKIPVTTKTDTEIDTGWDLPAKAIVLNVWVDVITFEATGTTKTIDIGLLSSDTGGDADGFVDGLSTATAAGIRKGTLLNSGQTLGAYLRVDESGAGVLVPEPHVAGSVVAKRVTYTLGSEHTELVANIYIEYALLGA